MVGRIPCTVLEPSPAHCRCMTSPAVPQCPVSIFKFILIFSLTWKIDRVLDHSPKRLQQLGLGQAKAESQELHLHLPRGWLGSKHTSHHLLYQKQGSHRSTQDSDDVRCGRLKQRLQTVRTRPAWRHRVVNHNSGGNFFHKMRHRSGSNFGPWWLCEACRPI